MKKYPWLRPLLSQLVALPMVLLALTVLRACGAGLAARDALAAPVSATVVLGQGQSVTIAPGSTLRLERVNDSRCRVGVVCVWAGYISYSFSLNQGAANTSFVLAEDMPGGVKSVTQNGWTFTLAGVEPAAVPAKLAPTPDYRVSLRVSNSPLP